MVLPKNELMEKIKTSNTIQNKTIFQTCQKRWDAVLNCLVTDRYMKSADDRKLFYIPC